MNDSLVTFVRNLQKVGCLLKIYSESEEKTDSVSSDQQKALLLKSYLSDVLPLSSQVLQALPVMMQQIYGETSRLEGQSLYEFFLDPNTALEDLRAAKELAKKKSHDVRTGTEKEVAKVVYYVAIAAAMAFHGEKISKHSYEKLRDSFYSSFKQEMDLYSSDFDTTSKTGG